MKVTLNNIREQEPCVKGWTKLLRTLGKTQADDEPLPIIAILDSNGLDDALWCLRAVKGHDKEIRLLMIWCARQVQHLMTDKRSLNALDVAERFANGEATQGELKAAHDDARDALTDKARASGAALAASEWNITQHAAWDAGISAEVDAAGEKAWAASNHESNFLMPAAWSNARKAARSAAERAQERKLCEICDQCEVTA